MDATTVAAPAQSTSTTTPPAPSTAKEHALHSGDFSAYRQAKQAEQAGKPLPVPEPAHTEPPVVETQGDATAAAASKTLSKRQQDINDRAQRAVESATAQLVEENARLKAELAAKTPAASASTRREPEATAAAAPAPTSGTEYERFVAMPDAPKQEAFERFDQWSVAMSLFVADKRHEERQAADRQREATERTATTQRERQTKFTDRFTAAKTADPTFVEHLSQDVLTLKPFSALQPGERGTALNAIAEELMDSSVGPQLMLHLSKYPEELQRLAAIADPRALIREFGRLEERFQPATATAAAASTPSPKTVPAAPAPPVTVGHRSTAAPADPIKAAMKTGDFGAYRKAKRDALRK